MPCSSRCRGAATSRKSAPWTPCAAESAPARSSPPTRRMPTLTCWPSSTSLPMSPTAPRAGRLARSNASTPSLAPRYVHGAFQGRFHQAPRRLPRLVPLGPHLRDGRLPRGGVDGRTPTRRRHLRCSHPRLVQRAAAVYGLSGRIGSGVR